MGANCVGSTKKYSHQNKTLPNFYYHPNEVRGPEMYLVFYLELSNYSVFLKCHPINRTPRKKTLLFTRRD